MPVFLINALVAIGLKFLSQKALEQLIVKGLKMLSQSTESKVDDEVYVYVKETIEGTEPKEVEPK